MSNSGKWKWIECKFEIKIVIFIFFYCSSFEYHLGRSTFSFIEHSLISNSVKLTYRKSQKISFPYEQFLLTKLAARISNCMRIMFIGICVSGKGKLVYAAYCNRCNWMKVFDKNFNWLKFISTIPAFISHISIDFLYKLVHVVSSNIVKSNLI